MNKNAVTTPASPIGKLSKDFVTGLLGISPEHHALTTEATWIRLAERLLTAARIEKQPSTTSRKARSDQ